MKEERTPLLYDLPARSNGKKRSNECLGWKTIFQNALQSDYRPDKKKLDIDVLLAEPIPPLVMINFPNIPGKPLTIRKDIH